MVTPRFVLVTGAALAYYICVGILIPTLPVFIEDGLGNGEAMIGASAVVFSASAVLFRPLITWVGNHWGRRTMMVSGGLLGSAAALCLTLVNSAWQILPLRGLMGIGEAALFVGAATLTVELSPENRKAEAASYLSVAVFGGLAIGPIIGELIMGDVAQNSRGLGIARFDAVFVGVALAAFMSAMISLASPAFVGERPVRTRVRAKWLYPAVLFPGTVMALGIAAWTSFTAFVPTYAKELGLGGSAKFFTLYSITCLIIRLFGAKLPERIGLRRTVFGAMSFLLFGVLTVAILANELGIWVGTVFFALGASFLYPSLLAMCVKGIEESERVHIVGSFTMFFEVGGVMGGLGLGAIGQMFGKRATFVGGAIFAVSGIILLIFQFRQSKRLLLISG